MHSKIFGSRQKANLLAVETRKQNNSIKWPSETKPRSLIYYPLPKRDFSYTANYVRKLIPNGENAVALGLILPYCSCPLTSSLGSVEACFFERRLESKTKRKKERKQTENNPKTVFVPFNFPAYDLFALTFAFVCVCVCVCVSVWQGKLHNLMARETLFIT